MSPRHVRRAPLGFTLVELLMVITIIGMLAGLGGYAAFQAMGRGINAAIALDVQSLASAMQSYKADHKQYPPDFSDLSYVNRQNRFTYHMGLAFPRSSITAYSTLKSYILSNASKSYGYNYMSGGTPMPLNLDTLDQAEALVFWLGGFPTPLTAQGVPMASRKLFGFHTDVTNPFRLDVTLGQNLAYRTTPLLDFDETRLVDNDNDGWLEYIPRGSAQGTNGKTPPYVYFDAGGYTQTWSSKTTPAYTGYPMPRPSDTNASVATQLMSAWGNAVPYASTFNTNASPPFPQWLNPTTFQIISAGGDGTYGNPSSTNIRIPCFPSGFTYAIPGLTQSFFDQAELDNITNFTKGTIDDDSASQQGIQTGGSSSSSSSSGSGS